MLDAITILMTSVGNDGFPSVLKAMKSTSEREVRVIAVDVRPSAPGLYLADKSYLVPLRRNCEPLLESLLEICRKENVNIIYPLSTDDQEFFAAQKEWFEEKGILILVSSLESLKIAPE